jgi:hypothetical protein
MTSERTVAVLGTGAMGFTGAGGAHARPAG